MASVLTRNLRGFSALPCFWPVQMIPSPMKSAVLIGIVLIATIAAAHTYER